MRKPETIEALSLYFTKHPDVLMAFVFGSRAKNTARPTSDWDVAVYFKPMQYAELGTAISYPEEQKIWLDIQNTLEAEVDMLVLNRARPSLVFSVLNSGTPLVIKDRKLYMRLLLKTHYEAVDFWRFVRDFWHIRERSRSLSAEDTSLLIEHLTFLENEFADFKKFQDMNWQEYQEDRDRRRNIERWIENLIMTSLDIAKIILASEKKEVPQTYAETLRTFASLYLNPALADRFAMFAELRNIIAHEYLDIRWARITNFLKEARELLPLFIVKNKEFIEDSKKVA